MKYVVLPALLLLTIVAYGSLASADFVYEDRRPDYGVDPTVIWPDYRASWDGWRTELAVWFPNHAKSQAGPMPRLLTTTSYRLNMWADARPRGFHLTNVAIHLVNGALLYAVALPLGMSAAAIAAGVFLLHPINSEAVSYVAARTDLLYAAAVLLMLWSAGGASWLRVAFVTFCGLLAVLAKESGVSVILLLPLWLWLRQRWEARWWLPLGAWSVGALGVAYRLLHVSSSGVAHPWQAIAAYTSPAAHGALGYAAVQAVALWRLLALWVWPVGLSIDHDLDRVPVAIGVVALLAGLGVVLTVRARWARFGIGWLLASLALRFVWPMPEYLHEQHLYVPMIGMCLALSGLLTRVSPEETGWLTRPTKD